MKTCALCLESFYNLDQHQFDEHGIEKDYRVAQAKRPTPTNFIQYLILRNYGEVISKKHIFNAYRDWREL